ncbi:MAG: hypothetical protein SNG14_08820, partial [Rikenellaceae bacterium]
MVSFFRTLFFVNKFSVILGSPEKQRANSVQTACKQRANSVQTACKQRAKPPLKKTEPPLHNVPVGKREAASEKKKEEKQI